MKPLSLLFLSLAPFLSFADAVDGAPAVGNVAQHRRAVPAQALDSPWHKRHVDSKRQADTGGDPPDSNNNGGPPTAFTVTLTSSDTTTTTPTDSATTTTTPTDSATTTTPTDSPTTAPTDTLTTGTPTDTLTTTTTPADTPTDSPTTTDVTTTAPVADPPPGSPTDAPTTTTTASPTDPLSGIVGGLTSDLGGITSDLGDAVSQVTSDLGGVTSDLGGVTSDLGGVTSDLGGLTTATDLPITTSTDIPPDQPTDTNTVSPPTDTGSPTDTTLPITTSSTTSQILDITDGIFPTDTNSGILSNPITTIIDSTSRPPISIDSQYQFITASSFLIAPTTTSASQTITNTDPDAALTTASIPTAGSAVTLTAGVIPSSIPMFITPPADSNPVPLGTVLQGYTQISILFQMTASWLWVLQSPETAAQILAYMPPIITGALNTPSDSLKTVGLKAFEPADLTSANDLMTMYVGQLKTDLVDDLSALIRDPNSAFYQSGDSIAQSIAKNVIMSFNIATLDGVSNADGSATSNSSTTTKVDNSRRNAIIGVSVAFGLIALAVFVWWILKTYRARREGAHKRLSYGGAPNYGTAGAGVPAMRAESPPALHNPFMTEREREDEARGIRRNSFYAIGPDDASLEEETFDYMSQRSSGGLRRERSGGSGWGAANSGRLSPNYGMGGHPYARKPVVGQPISQPILRESSMGNW